MTCLLMGLMAGLLFYMFNIHRRTLRHIDDCSKTVKHAKREFAEFAANICLNTYWRV
jgi:hypothetical protein